MHVHRAGLDRVGIQMPDAGEYFIAREYASFVLNQVTEKVRFLLGERAAAPILKHELAVAKIQDSPGDGQIRQLLGLSGDRRKTASTRASSSLTLNGLTT